MWPFSSNKPKSKTYPVSPLQFLAWRNHMWVMTSDGVGIITKLGVDSEVHLVDENGETISVIVYPTISLRQAKHLEIPKSRRHPDVTIAKSMGYV